MNNETKLFLGIIVATVGIIGAAVFALSRPATATTVDPTLLVKEDSHKLGSPSATLTLVEFGDFQCPACGAYQPLLKKLTETFKESLVLVSRNFPLSIHPNAMPAARAAEAAALQGKYWEMYDVLYSRQGEWSGESNVESVLEGYAKEIGLDVEQFAKDAKSSAVQDKIDADMNDANTLGINATPTFYLNNEKLTNPRSYEDFETLVKAALLKLPSPSASAQEETEAFHAHANIKMVVDGIPVDFSEPKYQSEEGKELSEDIHFHDGKGDVFHIHKKGVTLNDLFMSFGQNLDDSAFTLYVNGKKQSEIGAYQPKDLDRILLVDSSVTDPTTLFTTVADDACIYSEKCPERGTPPTEECVGGLGTTCE